MATQLAVKRLTKDFAKIRKDPIENCWIAPTEDNILLWYFIFELKDKPFKNCQVLCIMDFPKEYPLKAPDIKVLTPTGRFETGRKICMTNTGFHNESWSPLWSLNNLIIGFISSFYEKQTGLGHLMESDAHRMMLSAQSRTYNIDHYPEIVAKLISSDNSRSEDNGSSDATETKTERDVKRRKLAP